MNKLLSFFIPHVIQTILLIFGGAVILCIGIHFLHINQNGKEGLMGGVIFVLFPALAYFNRKCYLSASLDWILLAPIKKKDIILSHGVLNIFKVVLMFFLINVAYIFYYKGNLTLIPLARMWNAMMAEDVATPYSGLSIQDIMAMVVFLTLSLLLLFGILPSYLQKIQDKQDHRVGGRLWKNKKNLLQVIAGIISLFMLLGLYEEVEYYLPSFLSATLTFSIVLIIALNSTLTSVKYYYDKKLMLLGWVLTFGLSSIFTLWYARHDIVDKKLSLDERIGSADLLGPYAAEGNKLLMDEIQAAGPNTIRLGKQNLIHFFKFQEKSIDLSPLQNHLIQLCSVRKDHSCRLAANLISIRTSKPVTLEYIGQACPGDLASCYLILTHPAASKEVKAIAEQTLLNRCSNETVKDESGGCGQYRIRMIQENNKQAKAYPPLKSDSLKSR